MILSPPKSRNIEGDLSDLLDHCVSVGEEVGDVLDHFEQRVVVVVPGDLSPGHRPSTEHPALHTPNCVARMAEGGDRGRRTTLSTLSLSHSLYLSISLSFSVGVINSRLRRAAQFDDHMELWVRNLSRSGLVERAVNIALTGEAGDLLPDCLPSLAVLQGLSQRCGLSGEVLARSAPTYLGGNLVTSS